ncbi:hypothetical protein A2276_06040 [candidate division WOR-1 bacterium RIFOXYA12_FULL_43_27]|uniref:Glycosyltransferase 2-like domain-containing protein n=1 Tax=candidate division WOR-1 bacterium RIFOXYC2_FULL_46_14 TaxID=1802587 RepID=A0A1F4U388_UNCSA|nr:MAG: hypothetical protein A2276_06040 [candidate division WOR-1 bacterium RIFOXYA12_FULL_43_27]OGC20218.1 MAG: hypothetical protein A2292_04040 [candidate division WOR-1 bacterium RIFOXYB2_FULL_46_45]OGC32043.1 MAG: hypothetical protein A2232_07405 [candidate division WOR-1 bacterium RIFOXYA2_FULL_46_56]OGC39445.1 MAG: hypothetical protein A2438_07770 [candidate division WOR-1 bacterium RIFOXYC2_FULL_46_14]
MSERQKIKASVIMPMLNEEDNIIPAYERIRDLMDKLGYSWELICIDDGSMDSTYEKTKNIANSDQRVRVIRMSRNFGPHACLTSGLKVSQGNFAFAVGADLQEPIDQLPEFIKKWGEGYELIWGVRSSRKDPLLTSIFAGIFHKLFDWIGSLDALPKQVAFAFMDRKVINAILKLPERNRMVWGMLAWLGFRQTQIPCSFGLRERGKSRWTLAKRIQLAIDTFTSFSFMPIRIVSAMGILISFLSFLYGLFIIVGVALGWIQVQGWATLMITILFLSGLQLVVTGMIGEYTWRALDEARGRPLYVVSETFGFSNEYNK